jgi:hypothetical protein
MTKEEVDEVKKRWSRRFPLTYVMRTWFSFLMPKVKP